MSKEINCYKFSSLKCLLSLSNPAKEGGASPARICFEFWWRSSRHDEQHQVSHFGFVCFIVWTSGHIYSFRGCAQVNLLARSCTSLIHDWSPKKGFFAVTETFTPNFGMIYFRFAEFAFCIHVIVCLICRNLLIILENRTKLASTHSLKEITQCCILLHCDLDRVKPGSDPFSEICKLKTIESPIMILLHRKKAD
jgi:hypothetical protein